MRGTPVSLKNSLIVVLYRLRMVQGNAMIEMSSLK